MSKRWMMVASALLLCAAPQAAMAAARSMVTVTLGSQSPSGGYADIAEPGMMVGVSAGLRMSPWLAMGVDYAYFSNPGVHHGDVIDITEPSTGRPVTITLAESWSITELGLYAKAFGFERGRFSPYLRTGAGTYSLRYSQDVSTASTVTTLGGVEQASKVGVSGGAGVRYLVAGGTTLGLEVLYHRIFARDTDVSLWTTGVNVGFGPTGN